MGLKKLCLVIAMALAGWAWLARAGVAQDMSMPVSASGYAELSVLASSSGELQLFAIRTDSEIERRYQQQSGGAFDGVEVLGGQGLDLAAVQLPDASIDAFIIGMDSALWENRQQPDGSWSGWIRLGGEATRVASVSTQAGIVALLSLAADGQIEVRQRASDSSAWSEPQALDFQAKRLAAVADEAGASLTLFAIGLDDAVWRSVLDLAAPSSNDWQSFHAVVHDIAAARGANGRIELVAIGDDAAMWCNVEEDGVHAGWHWVGGQMTRVELGQSAGAFEALAVTPDGAVTVASLDAQHEWSAFTALATSKPTVTAEPLDSTFRGQVQVEIPSYDVTVARDLSFAVRFSADRTHVEITSFAPIVTDPFDTPFGSNVSTVSWVAGGAGTYDPSTGRVELPVTLHFDQSLRVPFVNTDVDASLPLTTDADGGSVPDADTGMLGLAASSTFSGSGVNPLSGAQVRVILTGVFDPRP